MITPTADKQSLPYDWATEVRRPWLGNPYHRVGEVVDVLWTRYFGPTPRGRGGADFVPQSYTLGKLASRRLRLAFIGDVLPAAGKRFEVGQGLRRFLDGADYLVLNLEGVIGHDRHVINGYRHEPSILEFLADLFPPRRTVLACANNHAADCGWKQFNRSYNLLKERGYHVLGRRDEPWLKLPEGVLIAAGTERLNVPGPYVSRFEHAVAVREEAAFRILFPHWGNEMHLYPPPRQIDQARRLLRSWDMIAGHHTHCPQPVADEAGKLVAYSLGNFHRGDGGQRGQHGIALRVDIGPGPSGRWQTGGVEWTFVRPAKIDRGKYRIEAARECRFFAP